MLRTFRMALALGVIVATTARAQDTTRTAPPRDYSAAMSLPSAEQKWQEQSFAVAPGIHFFHAPLGDGPVPLANETLIEQSDGLVLVDAGKSRGAGLRIVALIRAVSPKPVKAVIITHWHPDHVLGLGPIIEAWPNAVVVSSKATLTHLLTDPSYAGVPRDAGKTAERDSARAQALAGYAAQFGPNLDDTTLSPEEHRGWADVLGVLRLRIADERGTYLVLPTVTFDGHYIIKDASAPVEARFLGPAHTDGDIVVWMPKQQVVATGDVVVSPIPYGGTDFLAWPATLRHIEALHPRVIVPGHGSVQHDTRYVDLMISAFDTVREKAAALVSGPVLPDSVVQSRADLSGLRRQFAGDDHWLGYWFDQYVAPDVVEAYTELRAR